MSLPDGPAIAFERLEAASPCVLRRALTGSFGILNEPAGRAHGDRRTILYEGTRIDVDGASEGPDREIPIPSRRVSIDGRLGVVCLGGSRRARSSATARS